MGAIDFFMESETAHGRCHYYQQWQDPAVEQTLLHGGSQQEVSDWFSRFSAVQSTTHERLHSCLDATRLSALYQPDQQRVWLNMDQIALTSPYYPRQLIDLHHADPTHTAGQRQAIVQQIQAHRALFSRQLKTANALLDSNRALLEPSVDAQKLTAYAHKLCDPLIKSAHKGSVQSRLLSAFTADGLVRFDNTVDALCDEVIAFHDEHMVCAPQLLKQMCAILTQAGVACYACYSPYRADSELEGLLLPSASFAILLTKQGLPYRYPCKTVHATRFIDPAVFRRKKQRLKFYRKTAQSLLDEAVQSLDHARNLLH